MSAEVVCSLFAIVPKVFKFISNINCDRTIGCVIPVASGKTTITSRFYCDETTVLLDLESSVRLSLTNEQLAKLDELKKNHETTSYNSMFYISCRDYIKSQKKNFKDKRFIVFSSDKKLLKYIGCKTVLVFSPSDAFFSKILNAVEEGVKDICQKNRMEILLEQGKKQLFVYNSFDELASLLAKTLELKHKL
jgi:hypothetical protein